MATTIVTKYNSSSGNVPSSLTQGELAVNTDDGRLWVGHSSGVTEIGVKLGDDLDTNGNDITGAGKLLLDKGHAFTNSTQSINTPTMTMFQGTNLQNPQTYHIVFSQPDGTTEGSITSNQYSTTYNTTSDYRLKEDIQAVDNATGRLLDLNPCNFQWKGSDYRVDGFLAHELAEVIPDAVVGEKDAVDENGKPEYQGIDQSKIVPLLVAAVQELEARIKTLES